MLLPGHELVLHSWLSISSPGHGFPPNLGAGCVQFLERSRKPVPQDLLQDVHPVQVDQAPSTTDKNDEREGERNEKIKLLFTNKLKRKKLKCGLL